MRRILWLLLPVLAACTGGADPGAAAAADSTAGDSAATPVGLARVEPATLAERVSAPGRTDALQQISVRAPFSGTLVSLDVMDGDRVRAGQVIGRIVSRSSEAALTGARSMAASARTPVERQDAARALQLATQGAVRTPLRAPQAGVVISHATGAGGLVNEGDSVATIAAAGSLVFLAQIVQSELPRIQAGQRATVKLAAMAVPLQGTVRGVLPADSSANLSAPVRIDFAASTLPLRTGLFGTAEITVGERPGVPSVPDAAILRDDVMGTTRVAVVDANGRAHWVDVQTGISEAGRTEIVAPVLEPGTRVIVSGQVGLPDGSRVRAAPTATRADTAG